MYSVILHKNMMYNFYSRYVYFCQKYLEENAGIWYNIYVKYTFCAFYTVGVKARWKEWSNWVIKKDVI